MIWKYLVLIDNHTKSRSTLLKGKMTISMSHSHLEGGGFVGHIFGNQKTANLPKKNHWMQKIQNTHNTTSFTKKYKIWLEGTPTQLLTSSSHHVRDRNRPTKYIAHTFRTHTHTLPVRWLTQKQTKKKSAHHTRPTHITYRYFYSVVFITIGLIVLPPPFSRIRFLFWSCVKSSDLILFNWLPKDV